MKIAAFSTQTGAAAVLKATGVTPSTFPPNTLNGFSPSALVGFDVLYFHLHGVEGQPYWYGDGLITAISAAQIRSVDLRGVVVFVANCYGDQSQMVKALHEAGASAVVAGPGRNYTVENAVRGADLLGQKFIESLAAGEKPDRALEKAKSKLKLRALFSPIERDALQFKLQDRGA